MRAWPHAVVDMWSALGEDVSSRKGSETVRQWGGLGRMLLLLRLHTARQICKRHHELLCELNPQKDSSRMYQSFAARSRKWMFPICPFSLDFTIFQFFYFYLLAVLCVMMIASLIRFVRPLPCSALVMGTFLENRELLFLPSTAVGPVVCYRLARLFFYNYRCSNINEEDAIRYAFQTETVKCVIFRAVNVRSVPESWKKCD